MTLLTTTNARNISVRETKDIAGRQLYDVTMSVRNHPNLNPAVYARVEWDQVNGSKIVLETKKVRCINTRQSCEMEQELIDQIVATVETIHFAWIGQR